MSSTESHGVEEFVPHGTSTRDYVLSLLNEIKVLKGERDKYRNECQVLKETMHLKDQASKERLEKIKSSVNAQLLEIDASQTLSNGLLDADPGTGGYCALRSAQPQGEHDDEVYSDIYPTVVEEPMADAMHQDTVSSSFGDSIEEEMEHYENSETANNEKHPPPLPKRQPDQISTDDTEITKGSPLGSQLTHCGSKSASGTKGKKRNLFKMLRNLSLKKDRGPMVV